MTRAQVPIKTRKNPKQNRSNETVKAILDATAHILVKEGYERVSTNRIAEQAGVSIGSLYQYYPNKESILTAVYERHEVEIVDLLRVKLNQSLDSPIPELIQELIEAVIEIHRHDPKLHKILHEEVPSISSKITFENIAIELVAQTLHERRREVKFQKLEMAAFVIVHSVEAVIHSAVTQRPQYILSDDLSRELTNLVLGYLGLT